MSSPAQVETRGLEREQLVAISGDKVLEGYRPHAGHRDQGHASSVQCTPRHRRKLRRRAAVRRFRTNVRAPPRSQR